MKHTEGRIIDRDLAVERNLEAKRETNDFAQFIVDDIDRGILNNYVKPVLEKIGESYLLTPLCLDTIDDPSYDTIEVRKSIDIKPVTRCIKCKFLKTGTYTEGAGIWRKESQCILGHYPNVIYSFFCADGRPRDEAKED